MMKKIMQGMFILAALCTLRLEAQQSEQVKPPQEAAEVEEIGASTMLAVMKQALDSGPSHQSGRESLL